MSGDRMAATAIGNKKTQTGLPEQDSLSSGMTGGRAGREAWSAMINPDGREQLATTI